MIDLNFLLIVVIIVYVNLKILGLLKEIVYEPYMVKIRFQFNFYKIP